MSFDSDTDSGTGTLESAPDSKQPKKLRMFDMILFSVCAMLLLSQLTLSAAIGASSVFWTVVLIFLFFIPYGLITSELGSTYPDTGGIYAWVVRAFGDRWGTRVSWWYWLNVALWVPSVYLMFSGVFSSFFFDGKLPFWWQIGITVVLIWVNYWVNARSLDTGAWVSNLGAGITVVIILIVGIFGIVHGVSAGSETHWTVSAMLPSGGSALALALPVIIYNFMGFELMSSASGDMEEPSRDVPRATIFSGLLIGAFYLIATAGMLVLLPADRISSTTGLIDALRVGFGDSAFGEIGLGIVCIGALYCFFACLIPWTIGANISARESAQAGNLPRIFGKVHPERGTPTGASGLTAIFGTVFTVGYGALFSATGGAVDELFWNLFAFSSVIFLLPYVVMAASFWKLRREDPRAVRPYKVPGGMSTATVIVLIQVVLLLVACFFLIWNPYVAFKWSVTGAIVAGLVITVVIQEIFVKNAPRWAVERAAEAAELSQTAVAPDAAKPATPVDDSL